MAALGSQSIASSYEQLLHVDADGGGNGTTHVSLKDGDNGTTFPLTLATDAVMVTSTNRLEFGDNGTYIHQSADGVLDLVSDTEIELNGTIDINGAVTMDGGNVTINEDSGDYDFRVESDDNTHMLFVDAGNDSVGIGGATPLAKLQINGVSGTSPVTIIKGAVADTVSEFLRVGRSDSVERYHSIKTVNSATTANNYLSFEVHDASSTTATTEVMKLSGNGAVTTPGQPAFLVRPDSAQLNIAVGSAITVVFDGTDIFDQGGDFASNTFTAPVAGRYQFSFSLRLETVDSAASYYEINLVTHNRNYNGFIFDPDFGQDAGYFSVSGSVLADMDASDTAYLTVNQGSGTQQTDIAVFSHFSGYLAC